MADAAGRGPAHLESNRFVTGVTWIDGELWHGTWEGDESDIGRIIPEGGAVLERLMMPSGTGVSGLESATGQISLLRRRRPSAARCAAWC